LREPWRVTFRTRIRALVAAATGILVAIGLAAPAVADPQTYSVAITMFEGSTDDHLGNWHVEIGEISGGVPAVVAAFNSASRAAAQKEIDDLKEVAGPGSEWNLEIQGDVTFRSIAIAHLVISTAYYGAAPTITPTAIVIDSRTAQPITLADLFTDEQSGLQRLSEQTDIVLGKTHSYREGWAPKPENFANWIPTAEGMEIHFAPYQFGVRMADTITVPWPALSDVLAPEMIGLTR
jgi:hypothetical protein